MLGRVFSWDVFVRHLRLPQARRVFQDIYEECLPVSLAEKVKPSLLVRALSGHGDPWFDEMLTLI